MPRAHSTTFSRVRIVAVLAASLLAAVVSAGLAPASAATSIASRAHLAPEVAALSDAAALIEYPVRPPFLTLGDIAPGSDGNMWFTANPGQGNARIGRVTPSGEVTTFPFASGSGASGLVLAPDGNMWFTMDDGTAVGYIEPDGSMTRFPLDFDPISLDTPIVGPDGALWFTRSPGATAVGSIVRVTLDGMVTDFPLPSARRAFNLTVGADGNIWFGEWDSHVGRITPDGVITEFSTPGLRHEYTAPVAGADGNIWYATQETSPPNRWVIARISPDGVVTAFPTGLSSRVDTLAVGGDDRLWFTQAEGIDNTAPFRVSRMTEMGSTDTLPGTFARSPSVQAAPDGSTYLTVPAGDESWDAQIVRVGINGEYTRYPITSNNVPDLAFDSTGEAWLTDAGNRSIGHLVPVSTDRVGGADRYEVANLVAAQAFPTSAPVVYVATGENYPDALSAGPSAILDGAPVLLTAGEQLAESVAATIRRLDPATIVVVGGPDSVSDAVISDLADLQPNIVRLGGADRYAASRAVADYAFGQTGAPFAYVATGRNFPDALVAGVAGGVQGAPVILVDGSATTLDDDTRALLENLGVDRITIAGGPDSVSDELESALGAVAATVRLTGGDRFEAAQAVNYDAFEDFDASTTVDRAFIATGWKFADALSGSAWAGSVSAPLYVVPGDCVPRAVLADMVDFGVTRVTVLGGTASVTEAVDQLTPCFRSISDPVQ